MPPMIETLIAVPQSKEQKSGKELELEQEFELDIRISSVSVTPQAKCYYTHTSGARCCVSGTYPQCGTCA